MAWVTRLVNLLRSDRLSREIAREMAFHLDERADALMAEGMSEPEARLEARRRFGNRGLQQERTREADVIGWAESLAADVRYAARALRASPAFTAVAVLSLALGIGANAAIFSLVDAVLLRSLPVRAPEELVQVTMGGGSDSFTNPLWEQIRERQRVFACAFAYAEQPFDLAAGGVARRIVGNWVSGDYFATLGVRPALGRLLARADDVRGCPGIAVLGHGFWQSEYGGDPGVVGKAISLDGHPFQVVGVAGPGFFGVDVGRSVQVYAPLCASAITNGGNGTLDERSIWFLSIVARPRPGVTAAQASARLAAMAPSVFAATVPQSFNAEQQADYRRNALAVEPAATGLSRVRAQYARALVTLMAVVGLVLLIACANVANLLLARAAARRRELATRLALGAGRWRLVRQLLTESLLLAGLGAGLGLLFAAWGSRALVGLLTSPGDPVWLDLAVGWRVLGFATAVATLTGILFGTLPAWRAARVDPHGALKGSARGVVEGRTRFQAGKALVVGQVALSLVLVVGAGLLLGTFRSLATLDPGFRRDGVLLVAVDARKTGFGEERRRALHRELLEQVRAVPGVRSASASMMTPVSGGGWNEIVSTTGVSPARPQEALSWFNAVSDGYFATMGPGLIAGRDVGPQDTPTSARVALVNEAFVRKYLPGREPLGARVYRLLGEGRGALEIVGVVRDSKYLRLREEPEPIAYVPLAQNDLPDPMLNLEVRYDGATAALVPAVTAAIARVSPAITIEPRTIAEQLSASIRSERLLATLAGAFGALALALAVVGLYGTMAYSVARRRNEIGLRLALGAARERVLGMVMGEVGRLVAVGVALGAALTLASSRLVASFLYGVAPRDPATLALSGLVLCAVAGLAGLVPAWRAARLDPMVTLREE